uniref:Putative cysteine protease n=1 Tax=Davidia involucrata TaxID=16924 RepID=A0A5B7BLW9_DAVIN
MLIEDESVGNRHIGQIFDKKELVILLQFEPTKKKNKPDIFLLFCEPFMEKMLFGKHNTLHFKTTSIHEWKGEQQWFIGHELFFFAWMQWLSMQFSCRHMLGEFHAHTYARSSWIMGCCW